MLTLTVEPAVLTDDEAEALCERAALLPSPNGSDVARVAFFRDASALVKVAHDGARLRRACLTCEPADASGLRGRLLAALHPGDVLRWWDSGPFPSADLLGLLTSAARRREPPEGVTLGWWLPESWDVPDAPADVVRAELRAAARPHVQFVSGD